MIINLSPVAESKPTITFPVLARSISGLVVLFISNSRGIVIKSALGWTVGEYNELFVNVADPNWEILPKGSKVEFIQE